MIMELNNFSKSKVVSVIGTGNFGIALGQRLIKFGFSVIYGSRNPDNLDFDFLSLNFPQNENSVKVLSIKQAWDSSNIVFFAIHGDRYEDTIKTLFNIELKCDDLSRIVIDVSNNIEKKNGNSNALFLQNLFNGFTDKVKIVKAFNTISAYSMTSNSGVKGLTSGSYGNGETVLIASDDIQASDRIKNLADQLGFRGLLIGSLEKSCELESFNDQVFSEWKYPSLFSNFYFLFIFIAYMMNQHYSRFKSFEEYFSSFSLIKTLNSVCGYTALQLLAFTYLAGIFAALYQLKNKTKRIQFPKYLDLWLKSRKQLGLLAFLFAVTHMVLSLSILSPWYFPPWFKPIIQPKLVVVKEINETFISSVSLKDFKLQSMTLFGEMNIITGVFALILLSLLAISSINSIAMSFNWSEWNFVQTKIGYVCLAAALYHDLAMLSGIVVSYFRGTPGVTLSFVLTRFKFYAIWIPLFVLMAKLILTFLSPIRRRLENIRNGVDYRVKILVHKV
jgi:predicted dinucleotide-binding enzyme/DMSO/TMAO reductase YedYZ heme-binding membrane subunit